MEYLCAKCRRLAETEQCPYCGSRETRAPEDGDACYLAEWGGSGARILADLLNMNGIPFRTRKSLSGTKMEYYSFYVPYGMLEDAGAAMQKQWNSGQPQAAEQREGSGSELFDGEEIDRMEAAMLDSLDLEELKAYRNRITRTLKWIRVQEQQWKQRTNVLLDMREEAENLIDDLS